MDLPDLLVFSGLMALGQMIPGPDWILVTRHSLAGGRRAGVLTGIGIAAGLSIHASLALAGLTNRFLLDPRLSGVLDWLFAGYLVWLAIGILRARGGSYVAHEQRAEIRQPMIKGFLCNLLNVKVLVFLAALSASFVSPGSAAVWLLALWLVIVVQGGILWMAWAMVLQSPRVVRQWQRWERTLEYGFSALLLVMALRLVLQ